MGSSRRRERPRLRDRICGVVGPPRAVVSPDMTEAEGEDEAAVKPQAADLRPWGLCIPDPMNCTVHSTILPRTYWAYYSTVEDVDKLIGSLNDRGLRESDLKEKLLIERDRLIKSIKRCTSHGVTNKLASRYGH